MKGGIYSDQKCPVCGSNFKNIEHHKICCPNHPEIQPSKIKVRFGNEVTRRFADYKIADQFLTGLRFETAQGKFDPRDYRRDNPLGFENLVDTWLKTKRRLKGAKKYEQRIG